MLLLRNKLKKILSDLHKKTMQLEKFGAQGDAFTARQTCIWKLTPLKFDGS